MNRLTNIVIATTSLAFGLSAQDAVDASAPTPKLDIVETAAKAGSFSTLLAAAKAAGLVDALKGDGPITVFAPSDDAFAKLPEGTIPALLKDTKKLASILTYHVVPGKVMAADLKGTNWAKTLNGQSLRVVLDDSGASIDGSKVVTADIATSNGVIHVIDSVVMPRPNIVETAVSNGSFKTLVTAAKAAGLVEVLSGEGPFTIFAPSDAAFAKLPEGTVASLLKDKAKLAAILKFHVIPGRVLSTDLPMADEKKKVSAMPASVQGQKLEVIRSKTGVTVNGAKVVGADVLTGNGVIHVIDTVILPN